MDVWVIWSSLWCSNSGCCHCVIQSPIMQIDVGSEELMVGIVSLNLNRDPQNPSITHLLVFLVLLLYFGVFDFFLFGLVDFFLITKHIYSKSMFTYAMCLCQVFQLAACPLPYILTTGQIWVEIMSLQVKWSQVTAGLQKMKDLSLRCNNPEGIRLASWCWEGGAGRGSDDPCHYLGFVSSIFKVTISHCILHKTKLFGTQI